MDLRAPPQTAAPVKPTGFDKIVLLAVLVLGMAGGFGGWHLWQAAAAKKAAERSRSVASELLAAGASSEAAHLYEKYLQSAGADDPGRAGIELSIGNNYLEAGKYETALRWYYEAQADDTGELADTIGKKLVAVLERLGRTHAARAALAQQTQLGDTAARSADDPVVAQVGGDAMYKSDVVRALDDLPPELAKHFQGPQDYLKQYVADELLWRKAQKLEYDKTPEVQRQVDLITKRLAVQAFIGHEVVDKISVDENDLTNYFTVNKERYNALGNSAQAKEPRMLKDVRPQVEHDYRMSKLQAAYAELMEKELQTSDVKLYPERMNGAGSKK